MPGSTPLKEILVHVHADPLERPRSSRQAEIFRLAMMIAIADYHDDPSELVGRRDRFYCNTFTQNITSDSVLGVLVLQPLPRTLKISHSREHYERVRIFADSGFLLGTMVCVPEGLVEWSAPTHLSQP